MAKPSCSMRSRPPTRSASPPCCASSASTLTRGLLVAAAAFGVAFLLHLAVPAIPILTACVVLGLLWGNLGPAESTRPGLAFSAKTLLRIGVVLLGLSLSLVDIAQLGWLTLVLIVAIVGITFALTLLA